MGDRSNPPDAVDLVRQIAGRQLGLISSAQLAASGFGRGRRDWALGTGWLRRIRQGVYVLPGSRASWHRAVLAAVLAAGSDAVASHETAAQMWRLFDESADPNSRLHLTTPSQHRVEGAVVHRRVLPAREREVRSSVPVTSVARTLFDLADSLSPDALGRCTDEALRRSIVNLAELRRLLDIHGGPGRRRLGPLKVVLAERVPGFDPGANRWEHRMDQLWDRLGLPRAERQYRITVGNRRYVLDRAVPELRLAVEWSGVGYHGQLSRYRRDRTRISDLVQIGWDVLEVTPDWTPDRVRNTVWAKVAERQLIVGVAAG